MTKVETIVVKEVGKELKFEETEITLEKMQKLVGGYIECFRLPNNIDMWLNEEGILEQLKLNVLILNKETGQEEHHILGNIFFASHDDEGNTIGLTNKQIDWISENIKLIGNAKYPNEEEYEVLGFLL